MNPFLSIVGPLLVGLGLFAAQGRAESPPLNVVLIMADDIGLECFGCYGSEQYQTPRIDALAAEGLRFTNCFSQPLCTPSRVKIMTGAGNARNYVGFTYMDAGLDTFGNLMKRAGRRTFCAGKWQLTGFDAAEGIQQRGPGLHPSAAGFDDYCLWQVTHRPKRYWAGVLETPEGMIRLEQDGYGPELCVDKICQFLGDARDEPFFVYYPMMLVHDPFLPTPDSENRASKNKQRNFEDMVAYMDKCVGRIVDRLEQLGLRENTLVLFTGDNGTHKTIRSRLGDRVIKGGKGLTTDAGVRVPLVASWPGVAPPGAVCEDLIDFSDFLPTLADLSGGKPRPGAAIDGVSFAPQLRGEPGKPREFVTCYYWSRPSRPSTQPARFARDERWKLYGRGDFFDTLADPLEKKSVDPQGLNETDRQAYEKLSKALGSMPEAAVIYRPEE